MCIRDSARNRCSKVLLGIEWDAGAAILAPPEFTTSSFLHSRHGHLHTSPRFAQAIHPSQTAKNPQNITKKHPGRSFLRRRGAFAAGPCFWPTINLPSKTGAPPFGSLRWGTCGTGRRFFWRRFFEHFLGLPFSSRRAFQYRFWLPFWRGPGYPAGLRKGGRNLN